MERAMGIEPTSETWEAHNGLLAIFGLYHLLLKQEVEAEFPSPIQPNLKEKRPDHKSK
jgi:hypothetical protein